MAPNTLLSHVGFIALVCCVVGALNPACAPGGNFDLSPWELQLPIGHQYFFTESSDAVLVMKVPGSPDSTGCVTTPNSLHCRTELREINPSSWNPNQATNRLTVTLAVPEPDDSGHGTVIGQFILMIAFLANLSTFTYEIRYESNVLSVSINNAQPVVFNTFQLDAPSSYFKVGNYNQGDSPSDVHFFAISVTHATTPDPPSTTFCGNCRSICASLQHKLP
ncbi:hypothetical protein B7463_g8675, partial [Scytalidium lignicola]